jgi:hypothetical protein
MADLTTLLSKFLTALYAGNLYSGNPTGGSAVGLPVIQASGRSVGATAAVASLATVTVGASDGTFEVVANVNVTTATTHSFSVQCGYTDETNTARTITLAFRLLADTTSVQGVVANGNGAVPYVGVPVSFRAKAGTAITVMTQAAGTYTAVVFNVEGQIRQIA